MLALIQGLATHADAALVLAENTLDKRRSARAERLPLVAPLLQRLSRSIDAVRRKAPTPIPGSVARSVDTLYRAVECVLKAEGNTSHRERDALLGTSRRYLTAVRADADAMWFPKIRDVALGLETTLSVIDGALAMGAVRSKGGSS